MQSAKSIYYKIDYNKESKVYTGFCPDMEPVRFSGKNRNDVVSLVEDGIDLYLKNNPRFFENYYSVTI